MKKEIQKLLMLISAFLVVYYLPFNKPDVSRAIVEGFVMLQDYARHHVLLCLVPAFFIAGAITVFAKKEAVLKLLGPKTKKLISYPVASVSGAVLAVCSCTILPLFAGIWKRGAGIGPAVTFLYAGPAINIAAIFLTGTVLGWEMSIVRLIFSLFGAVLIGLLMAGIFRDKGEGEMFVEHEELSASPISIGLFFLFQLGFMITGGLKIGIWPKVILMSAMVGGVLYIAFRKFDKEHNKHWMDETWTFTKKILPMLFAGVFIAGIISKALPEETVNNLLGGNRLGSAFFASVFGAIMYFATLTEVPIIQSLMSLGMGKGPALSLFLAGYSLSLPNMIVLFRLMGAKRAFTYIILIVTFSAFAGFIYGNYLFF